MISRNIRYGVFTIILGLLIAGNALVHVVSMNLSEGSLVYEKGITTLKQSNLRLESEILSKSSLQTVAAFATSKGYKNSGPAVRWMEPVIAARQ